jgi:hypothetical protein
MYDIQNFQFKNATNIMHIRNVSKMLEIGRNTAPERKERKKPSKKNNEKRNLRNLAV